MTPEDLARTFHNIYERLAPQFGYETRDDTRQFDPTSPNGRLMIAVCSEIQALWAYDESAVREALEWLETQWSLLLDHVTNGKLSKPYAFKDIESVVDDEITASVNEAVAEELATTLVPRCGTCRWWGSDWGREGNWTKRPCFSPVSCCHILGAAWPADHGCPNHERKYGAE